jgi:hypothetical protein
MHQSKLNLGTFHKKKKLNLGTLEPEGGVVRLVETRVGSYHRAGVGVVGTDEAVLPAALVVVVGDGFGVDVVAEEGGAVWRDGGAPHR